MAVSCPASPHTASGTDRQHTVHTFLGPQIEQQQAVMTSTQLACVALLGAVLLAGNQVRAEVNAAKIEGYCGFHSWARWSPCRYRQKEYLSGGKDPINFNEQPILCFKDVPGYTARSRYCVEGMLCGDPSCNKKTGNGNKCMAHIQSECASLRRNKAT